MNRKKKLLAKIAYLYYVENKTQTEISKMLDIYRTSVSRMLAQAKKEGIIKIEIVGFDSDVFALEEYVKQKYDLHKIDITVNDSSASEEEKNEALAQSAAQFVRNVIFDNQIIGISWGSTLSRMIEKLENRYMENTIFCPLAGGPSHINSKYHVNTLVYKIARKFHGKSSFVNATVIQENEESTDGILQSKYFQNTLEYWRDLDVAIVGVGGSLDEQDSQWRDLLTKEDYCVLEKEEAVGECSCRFFNREGKLVYNELQNRTIGISLANMAKIPKAIAIARGDKKVQALLAMIRKKYVNCIVSDRETIIGILHLDNDYTFG
ncbi:sugar-binding transcriptional regulator [Enterococcus faecalis]|uniref:sugar-binding transcriptional regulator n=1 Tax=Enterococcus faecalis TaxID=1351 RepID=UPI0034CD9918